MAREARRRAYASYVRRRDRRAAARVAVGIADDALYVDGEPAVAQGWIVRARGHLRGGPRTVEHALVELMEGDFILTTRGEPVTARRYSSRAASVARALGEEALTVVAEAQRGAALVAEARVGEGMRALDGAIAAALAPGFADPQLAAFVCCYLLSACESARDFDRSEQWRGRIEDHARRTGIKPLFAVSQVHHAGALIARGEWALAERLLGEATAGLEETRPGLCREPRLRLARLRLLQGRLDDAEALIEANTGHPHAALEHAALALERGEPSSAARLSERFLRALPSSRKLDRLAALDVLVRAHVAGGRLEAAARALPQLRRGASGEAFGGISRLAEGIYLHEKGRLDAARQALEDAVDRLEASGGVVDAARARVQLARCLGATGDRRAASQELRSALRVLERVGAAREIARASASSARREGACAPARSR